MSPQVDKTFLCLEFVSVLLFDIERDFLCLLKSNNILFSELLFFDVSITFFLEGHIFLLIILILDLSKFLFGILKCGINLIFEIKDLFIALFI